MNQDLRAKLEQLITPVVIGMGYELWGIEFKPSPAGNVLRIYIESETGVSLDDCGTISHQVSGLLDVEDPIVSKYNLEVSSPGMDRRLFTLDHLRRTVGKNVHVKLFPVTPGERHNFVGQLTAVTEENITLNVSEEIIVLPFDKIEKAKLVTNY